MQSVFFITSSASATRRIGTLFARTLVSRMPFPRACVFGLEGNLGAGKTTFMQGVAQGLHINRRIISPTFMLMRTFPFYFKGHAGKLTHVDCWRIGSRDLLDLGFSDLKKDSNHIICLEWADRVKAIMPIASIRITFSHISKNKRKVTFLFP